jgi:hypothetical protein
VDKQHLVAYGLDWIEALKQKFSNLVISSVVM